MRGRTRCRMVGVEDVRAFIYSRRWLQAGEIGHRWTWRYVAGRVRVGKDIRGYGLQCTGPGQFQFNESTENGRQPRPKHLDVISTKQRTSEVWRMYVREGTCRR